MRPQRLLSGLFITLISGALAVPVFAQASNSRTAAANPNGWRRMGGAVATPVSTAAAVQAPTENGPAPQESEPQQQQLPPDALASGPPRPALGHLLIPAGTWMTIRIDQLLSSEFNHPGDAFGATLAQPIVADGYVVARRGQMITGRVTESVRAGRVKGTSRLGVEISDIGLADGQQVPVRTQLAEFSGGTSRGNDAAIIGGTTGAGAAIGAAAGGGFGAGMGAIAGAGASAIGVLLSRGRDTVVPPEATMRFRLLEPVAVNTERAPHAFQAVQQNDFESRPAERRLNVRQPANYGGSFYGGGGYYGAGGWGPYYGGGYWSPYYGGFGGWGFGPRFSIGIGGRGWYGGRGGYRGRR